MEKTTASFFCALPGRGPRPQLAYGQTLCGGLESRSRTLTGSGLCGSLFPSGQSTCYGSAGTGPVVTEALLKSGVPGGMLQPWKVYNQSS